MTVTVHKSPAPQFTAEELLRWRNMPVAIVADVSSGACLLDPDIRPLNPPGKQPRLFGTVVTALCQPPDFGAVLHALDEIKADEVLLIAAQGHRDNAMIGEILGGHLRRLGAAGVVCDGAVRDVAELAGWTDLSVYCRSITPRGPVGAIMGAVNSDVTVGSVTIHPGDLLLGDDDGLAVLSPAQAHNLFAAAAAKLALEIQWQKKLSGGQTIKATFGL